MSPIHHHFELKGWDEPTVVVRFWILSLVGAMAALLFGRELGGIGALAPNKRDQLAKLGFRAMIAGTMANLMSAAIVGLLMRS